MCPLLLAVGCAGRVPTLSAEWQDVLALPETRVHVIVVGASPVYAPRPGPPNWQDAPVRAWEARHGDVCAAISRGLTRYGHLRRVDCSTAEWADLPSFSATGACLSPPPSWHDAVQSSLVLFVENPVFIGQAAGPAVDKYRWTDDRGFSNTGAVPPVGQLGIPAGSIPSPTPGFALSASVLWWDADRSVALGCRSGPWYQGPVTMAPNGSDPQFSVNVMIRDVLRHSAFGPRPDR